MPDQGRHIDGGRACLKRTKIGHERFKPVRGRVGDKVQGRHRIVRPERRKADAAVARDHGRDALAHLGLHQGIGKQQPIIVGMHVDEARGHHQAPDIDDLVGTHVVQITHRDNHTLVHRNIRTVPGLPGAIDHHAAKQQQVALFHRLNTYQNLWSPRVFVVV